MKALILLLLMLNVAFGARILCVFNMFAYSHHILGHRLLEELASRGHEVVMVSPFKNEKPIKNYRDIQIEGMREAFEAMMKEQGTSMDIKSFVETPAHIMGYLVNEMGLQSVDYTFKHPNFQSFLKENQKFDLVILEQFYNDALKGLCHHFNAPCVLMSTIGLGQINNYLFGNSAPPSYIPNFWFGFNGEMTFYQRLCNFLSIVYEQIIHYFIFTPKQNELLHKYFPDSPDINELLYNHNSIILLNSHPSVNQPVPHTPNMIEIGGFHVKPPKKLPENLQNYMDSAKDGVILFSLGSNIQSADLPEEKVRGILAAFGKLKQKIIWKFENEDLPGKPDNVLISKWVPQPDVLGHPNLKLFITHGGLLSALEAVYNAVPMIAIPIGADQKYNAAINNKNKIAIKLDYHEISEETLSEAINKILSDKTYKENVKKRSQLIQDQPLKPMDAAVYWTEFMIKHKGVGHLRSAALDLCWFTYTSLDVILFFAIVIFLIIAISVKLICCTLTKFKCCKKSNNKPKTKLKKVKKN